MSSIYEPIRDHLMMTISQCSAAKGTTDDERRQRLRTRERLEPLTLIGQPARRQRRFALLQARGWRVLAAGKHEKPIAGSVSCTGPLERAGAFLAACGRRSPSSSGLPVAGRMAQQQRPLVPTRAERRSSSGHLCRCGPNGAAAAATCADAGRTARRLPCRAMLQCGATPRAAA